MLWRSVVRVGSLQLRVTRLPLRLARRSDGGLGSSSDGGSGGPSWAQLASKRQSAVRAICFLESRFMREKDRVTEAERVDEAQTPMACLWCPHADRSVRATGCSGTDPDLSRSRSASFARRLRPLCTPAPFFLAPRS